MRLLPSVFKSTLLVAAAFVVIELAQAQSPDDLFYKGRSVPLLVGFAPGGINDISARLVARYLPRFLPGSPTLVVQNQPSAGGLAVANYIYNVAPKDGSVLAGVDRATPQLAIEGEAEAKFDPAKFTWLGSISSYANDAYLLLVNSSSPVRTVEDLRKSGTPIRLGAVSAGSTNLIFAQIARDVLHLNVDIIRGYTGAAPIFLAMRSGELDGQVIGLSSVKSGQRDLWDNHLVRPLVQFGRETRLPELADIPTGRELAPDDDARALIAFAELPFFMALPFVAPPDLPPQRAKLLQDAFAQMVKDTDFIADAQKIGLDVSPIGPDQLVDLFKRSAATSPAVIARYNAILSPQKN
jgi:tripartite-type tricarboxylate transporter receptor subunit TctC